MIGDEKEGGIHRHEPSRFCKVWRHYTGIYWSNTLNIPIPPFARTHTCGSMERWMGGVRAGCMPPLLKDSERGGREGSEIRLDTCCSAGELCLFSLDRSSTWDRSHTTVIHSLSTQHNQSPPRAAVGNAPPRHAPLHSTRQSQQHTLCLSSCQRRERLLWGIQRTFCGSLLLSALSLENSATKTNG